MKEQIEEYLNQGTAQGWSAQTLANYRKTFRLLLRHLTKLKLRRFADVRPDDLDAWFLEMSSRHLRQVTLRSRASTVRNYFRWLAERGLIISNPARDILLPVSDDELELPTPPLEENDVAVLLDRLPRRNAADLRNRLHLELLYGCALRLGESIALNVDDLDFASRTVRVIDGKGGRNRVIPMMRGVIGAAKDYLALRRTLVKGPDTGALLLSRRGERLNPATFRMWLSALNKSRGNKRHVYPHLLRHSIAVHFLRNGADIRYVQELLGHALLETTKIYLRLVPGHLREEYDDAMPEIAVNAR
jgi:integrase/recombinase XerC